MNKKIEKILIAIAIVLVICGCVFMFMPSLSKTNKDANVGEATNREMPDANGTTEELTKGVVVEQNFINATDSINQIAVVFSRLYFLEEKDAQHTLAIEILDGNNVLLNETFISNDIPDQHRVFVDASSSITGLFGKELTLRIYENSNCDTGVALMINSDSDDTFKFDNHKMNGSICFSVSGN